MKVSDVAGYPKIFQVMNEHDLVIDTTSRWLGESWGSVILRKTQIIIAIKNQMNPNVQMILLMILMSSYKRIGVPNSIIFPKLPPIEVFLYTTASNPAALEVLEAKGNHGKTEENPLKPIFSRCQSIFSGTKPMWGTTDLHRNYILDDTLL